MREYEVDQRGEVPDDGNTLGVPVVPAVAVDEGGAHSGGEGAGDVGAGLVADVEGVGRFDAEGSESGAEGPNVRFFPADDGGRDDRVHLVGEGEVGAEGGDVGVGVGDDGASDAGFAQALQGRHDVVEDVVAAGDVLLDGGRLELRQVPLAGGTDGGGVGRQTGGGAARSGCRRGQR